MSFWRSEIGSKKTCEQFAPAAKVCNSPALIDDYVLGAVFENSVQIEFPQPNHHEIFGLLKLARARPHACKHMLDRVGVKHTRETNSTFQRRLV